MRQSTSKPKPGDKNYYTDDDQSDSEDEESESEIGVRKKPQKEKIVLNEK